MDLIVVSFPLGMRGERHVQQVPQVLGTCPLFSSDRIWIQCAWRNILMYLYMEPSYLELSLKINYDLSGLEGQEDRSFTFRFSHVDRYWYIKKGTIT